MPASRLRRVWPGKHPAYRIDPKGTRDKIADRVLPKEGCRQSEQSVDHRSLQLPVEHAFQPKHGNALHHLHAGHRNRGHGERSCAKCKLVQLGARDDGIDELLNDERSGQRQ